MIDVIIPTYDNPYWFTRCLMSFQREPMRGLGKILVVDNGGTFDDSPYWDLPLQVLRPGKNLGWAKALKYAMKDVTADYVMFLNDDTEFEGKADRLELLLSNFKDPSVGAVGPATGICLGLQAAGGPDIEETKVLIGFCFLVKREALEKVGGIDDRYNMGGDDLDISIRLRDAGYKLLIDRRVFVHHNCFKTGTRLYGRSTIKGGWNSQEMSLAVYAAIEAQHGKEKLLECITGPANRF